MGNNREILERMMRDSSLSEKQRLRIEASLKLPELCKRFGYCYHWCGCMVLNIDDAQRRPGFCRRISQLEFLHNGSLVTFDVATVDHVERFHVRHNNSDANLVLACMSCNTVRDKIAQKEAVGKKTPNWDSHLKCRQAHKLQMIDKNYGVYIDANGGIIEP